MEAPRARRGVAQRRQGLTRGASNASFPRTAVKIGDFLIHFAEKWIRKSPKRVHIRAFLIRVAKKLIHFEEKLIRKGGKWIRIGGKPIRRWRSLTLFTLLRTLDERKIRYELGRHREGPVMVKVAVPGERWEVEFFADGTVEVEAFRSVGGIVGAEALERLFHEPNVE